jgi:hypothetical protein
VQKGAHPLFAQEGISARRSANSACIPKKFALARICLSQAALVMVSFVPFWSWTDERIEAGKIISQQSLLAPFAQEQQPCALLF